MTAYDRFLVRFMNKIDKTDTCWNWTASKNKKGYGQVAYNGRMYRAHRVSYGLVNGEIPYELQIHHLCKNKGCVNPAHLEAVTSAMNNQYKSHKSILI